MTSFPFNQFRESWLSIALCTALCCRPLSLCSLVGEFWSGRRRFLLCMAAAALEPFSPKFLLRTGGKKRGLVWGNCADGQGKGPRSSDHSRPCSRHHRVLYYISVSLGFKIWTLTEKNLVEESTKGIPKDRHGKLGSNFFCCIKDQGWNYCLCISITLCWWRCGST